MDPEDFNQEDDSSFGYDPEFYGDYEDDRDTTEDDWRERAAD